MSAPQGEVHGSLALEFDRRLLNGNLAVKVADFTALGRILDEPLQGALTLDLRLDAVDGLQQARVQAEGHDRQATGLGLRRFSLGADLQDLFHQPHGRVELSATGLTMPPVSIDATALRLEGDRRALRFSAELDGRSKQAFGFQTTGQLTLTDRAWRLALTRLEGRFGAIPIRLAAPASLEGGGARQVSLTAVDLRLGPGKVTGSGRLDGERIAADLRVRDLPLGSLRDFGPVDLEGQVNLAANWAGTLAAPTFTLESQATHVRVLGRGLEQLPPGDLVLTGKFAAGRLDADARWSGLTEAPLVAQGRLPLVPSFAPMRFEVPATGELRAGLRGRLQLEALAAWFLPAAQVVSGTVEADLALGGSVASPRFSGGARIRDGRYENLDTGTVLSRIGGDLRCENDRLVPRRLEAAAGRDGSVSARGALALAPERNFRLELEIRLRQAKLVHTDELEATAAGDLRLTGELRALELGGQLILTPIEARIPAAGGSQLPHLSVIEINKPDGAVEPEPVSAEDAALPLGLRLILEMPSRVFVRGRGLDSEWAGRVHVNGTAARPVLLGDLELVRGHLDFMGKRLQLRDSRIQFDGADPPDPFVTLRAESVAAGATVTILVSGTASAPTIELASEPTLPDDEILARLLFGRNAARISPTQAIRLALALKTLAGGNALDLQGRSRRFLGFDQLELREGADGVPARVGIGKYLSDDLYLDVEQGTDPGSGRVRVELEVLPNITIDGEVTGQAQAGVGLNWKHDY